MPIADVPTDVVLLPGLGSRREVWDPVIATLPPTIAAIAIDLPGRSRAGRLAQGAPRSVERYADAIAEQLRHLDIDRPLVAGNSLGGAIALELGRREVAGAVLAISPIGFWTPGEARAGGLLLRMLQMTARATRPVQSRLSRSALIRQLSMSLVMVHGSRLRPDVATADARALADWEDFSVVLPDTARYRFSDGASIAWPLTIAWGRQDRLLPQRQFRRALTMIPAAEHVSLAGCGHVAMADDPGRIAELIVALSTRTQARAATG